MRIEGRPDRQTDRDRNTDMTKITVDFIFRKRLKRKKETRFLKVSVAMKGTYTTASAI